jgi:KTSC domain-containing protein
MAEATVRENIRAGREIINMKLVKSSLITWIGWANEKLYLVLNSGQGWCYDLVPESIYQEHERWMSLGQWYNVKIKGKFQGTPFIPEVLQEGEQLCTNTTEKS